MLKLFVHSLGAWFAAKAVDGSYPRPVAMAAALLVTRLGAPTAMLALAGFAFLKMRENGAFDGMQVARVPSRRTQRD